jgi:hypothetical protein
MLCCFPFLFPETQEHICYVMEMSKCLYMNSCLLQQLTNKYNLTKKTLTTELRPASYYIPPTQAHTFSLAQYFEWCQPIFVPYIGTKLHTHLKEMGKSLLLIKQISGIC